MGIQRAPMGSTAVTMMGAETEQGASDDILFNEDLEAPSPFDTGLQDLTFDEEVPSLLEPSAPKLAELEFASFVPGAAPASPPPSSEGVSLMDDYRQNDEFVNASKFRSRYLIVGALHLLVL